METKQTLNDKKVLIVDDSAITRIEISKILDSLKLYTIEASTIEEALTKINEYPEIKLILTSNSMKNHDSIDLVHDIRNKYSNKEISIIGFSDSSNAIMSADFLKYGANDFIYNLILLRPPPG